jgi:hypothetical protein
MEIPDVIEDVWTAVSWTQRNFAVHRAIAGIVLAREILNKCLFLKGVFDCIYPLSVSAVRITDSQK